MSGDIIDLNIEGLSAEGAGVGREQGLAVFVPGALPGETVRARLVQVKKNYARAELMQIIRPAAGRVEPACPQQAGCGGCVLQHLAYEEQLRWKRQWLDDALKRIGGLEIKVLPTLGAEQPFHYRNRVQLHAAWQGGELKLGFYARGSRELAAVGPCPCLRPLLARITRLLTEILPTQAAALSGLQHVALRCDSAGERALLTLVGSPAGAALTKLAVLLMEREPRLVSVWANWGQPLYGIYGGRWQKLAGEEKLADECAGLRLEISPGAFTQINSAQARRLYGLVEHYAGLSGAETLLDIYSGIGVIALLLAPKAQAVVGVEEYVPAVADALRNAKLNGIVNCRFEAGRAEQVLPRLATQGLQAEVAVLDPPRAGCEAAALTALAALQPQRIVYVSCAPATLARDLRLLAELGYAAKEAQPLDMFPQTGHVEAIVLLERAHTFSAS